MKKIDKLREQRDTLRAMYQSWDTAINDSGRPIPAADVSNLASAREALNNACTYINKILSGVDGATNYWMADPEAAALSDNEDVQRRERRELRTV